jgi:hypothetical protein
MNTHRLTASEAYAYVTLESYIITAGEFESIETSHQGLSLGVLFPLAKYRGICCAAVFIGHHIFILQIVLHSLGDAVARKSAVNSCNIVTFVFIVY